jgi:hypothetical protein
MVSWTLHSTPSFKYLWNSFLVVLYSSYPNGRILFGFHNYHSNILIMSKETKDTSHRSQSQEITPVQNPNEDRESARAAVVVQEKVKRTWTSYLWDTLDKSPEERRFLFKLDCAILTFGTCGSYAPSSSLSWKANVYQVSSSSTWISRTLIMLLFPACKTPPT